jgi:hypothetical protein
MVDAPSRWGAAISLAAFVFFDGLNRTGTLACPAGVCDREGTSRFPWAFSPVTGSSSSRYGIARPLSRLALCGFVCAPSFRSAATAGGRVSRLASWRATRSVAEGSALTPKSPPAVHCERSKEGGKTAEGQMQVEQTRSPWQADSRVGRQPRAARLCRHREPAGAAKPLTSRKRQRSAKPPDEGDVG